MILENCWNECSTGIHFFIVNDVAELTDRTITLEREAKIKNALLSKVKVVDL